MWKHTETKPHLHFSLSLYPSLSLALCLVAKQLFSGDNLGSGISHSNKDTHNPLQYIAYSWKRKSGCIVLRQLECCAHAAVVFFFTLYNGHHRKTKTNLLPISPSSMVCLFLPSSQIMWTTKSSLTEKPDCCIIVLYHSKCKIGLLCCWVYLNSIFFE